MLSGDINNRAGQKNTVFSNKENLVMALQVIAIKITTKTLYIFMCFLYIYIYVYYMSRMYISSLFSLMYIQTLCSNMGIIEVTKC